MEDVINDLKKIKSETLKRRAMIRIWKKAARPIVLAERQALSPSKGIETGLLKKSLGSWTYPKGRNGDFTMVGVSARVKSGKFQKVAKYSIPFHWGSDGLPFAEIALRNNRTKALEVIKKQAKDQVKKTVKSKNSVKWK